MAIASGIPGLEVTIEVDHTNDSVDHEIPETTVEKFVESSAGASFEIRTLYKKPFDPPLLIQKDIMLDGNYVQALFEAPGGRDGCEEYQYGQATFIDEGSSVTRNFRFAELEVDENDRPLTEDSKRQVSNIGQIVLYFYYIETLKPAQPTEIPRSEPSKATIISQKSSQRASYAK